MLWCLPPPFTSMLPSHPPLLPLALQVDSRRRALDGDVVVSVSAESFILRSLSGSTRLDSIGESLGPRDREGRGSLSMSFGEGKSEEWMGKSLEQEASTAPATASNGASESKVSHSTIGKK